VHADTLHRHSGHADNIGTSAALVVDRLDILVDDRDRMLGRGQRRQQGEVERRQNRSFAEQRQRVVEAPIGRIKPRIDQNNIGHIDLRCATPIGSQKHTPKSTRTVSQNRR
jgi:hypothetical protein